MVTEIVLTWGKVWAGLVAFSKSGYFVALGWSWTCHLCNGCRAEGWQPFFIKQTVTYLLLLCSASSSRPRESLWNKLIIKFRKRAVTSVIWSTRLARVLELRILSLSLLPLSHDSLMKSTSSKNLLQWAYSYHKLPHNYDRGHVTLYPYSMEYFNRGWVEKH